MKIAEQIKKLFSKYKRQIYFHLLLNLITAISITYASYAHLPLNGFKDYSIYFIHFLLLQFSFFGVLYFVSLNKYVFYIVFPILFFVLSGLSFYVYTQDIVVSKYLIESIFQTSLLVSVELFSVNLIIFSLALIVLLYFIFKQYNKIGVSQLKSPLLILAILGLFTYNFIEDYRFNTFRSRMPFSAFHSLRMFFKNDDIKLLEVNKKVTSVKKEVTFIFILGESVRADNLQLNGYERETNPLLSKRKNILSFPNLYTPFTHTVPCVKQMLTSKSIKDDENLNEFYSVFSVLNQADYETFWIANSTLVSSYESIIKSNKNLMLIDKFRSIVSFNKALDDKMLQPFDSIYGIKKNQFIGLHMTGSHWWYENRYSDAFRKFKPVIDSKHIPSLKKEQIINSYDNTLVYLDNFINEVIKRVENKNTSAIVLYVSDHGEVLGEHGKWLHAQGLEESKNPAMILWYSDKFKNEYPEYVLNLKANAKKEITTDFLFHSILDFYNIQNFDYNKSQSIFTEETLFERE